MVENINYEKLFLEGNLQSLKYSRFFSVMLVIAGFGFFILFVAQLKFIDMIFGIILISGGLFRYLSKNKEIKDIEYKLKYNFREDN